MERIMRLLNRGDIVSEFIEKYKELRSSRCMPTEAFGLVACRIAASGDIHDLQVLYQYYDNDFWNECEQQIKSMGEFSNESTTSTVSRSAV